jgi:hypothetical protein
MQQKNYFPAKTSMGARNTRSDTPNDLHRIGRISEVSRGSHGNLPVSGTKGD